MLRSGYFDDFKGGPKVLFWGDGEAMQKLAARLRLAATGDGVSDLASLNEAVDGNRIVIEPAAHSFGMLTANEGFRWVLDPETMLQFAEMVDVLVDGAEPAHQYLECLVPGGITVMVARDEYPANLHPKVRLDGTPA